MSKLGKTIISALKDAEKNGLVALHPSPDVAELRKKLKLTQKQFASAYHINPETIKKWEQKKRKPDIISCAYLKCIQNNPILVQQWVNA